MSEANRAQLLYVAESAWGVTPTGPPTLTVVRRTGGSFSQNPAHSTSAEVRADRQLADLVRTGIAPTGSIDFEMSFSSHDDLLEGVFLDTWSTAAKTTSASNFNVVASTGAMTLTAAFTNIVVDQWFEVQGSASPGNNGWHRVKTRADANGVTVYDTSGLVDATNEDAVVVKTDGMLRAGTTFKSFTFEEEYQDVSQAFMTYRGQTIGSMTLNVAPGSLLTGTFGDMMGGVPIGSTDDAVDRPTATVGDGTPTAAGTDPIMNAVDHVADVREGDVVTSMLISGLTFTLNNSLREIPVVAHLGPADINPGTIQVTGQISAYLGTNALTVIDKMLADTPSRHSFRLVDANGSCYVFTVPSLKYTGGPPEMGTLDTDVPVNLAFTGSTSGGVQFQVDRFDVTV
jgi:hypothetical protein